MYRGVVEIAVVKGCAVLGEWGVRVKGASREKVREVH